MFLRVPKLQEMSLRGGAARGGSNLLHQLPVMLLEDMRLLRNERSQRHLYDGNMNSHLIG